MACLGRRTGQVLAVVLLGVCGNLAGCQLTPSPGLMACPLPVAEQAAKVVQMAPLGTSREEVMQRLKDAGITGNFGENQSIFYCDTWKRDKTERWHINVVLLFDEQGRLYATRPSLTEADKTAGVQHVSSETHDPFER